ncbi:hypothetical protein [Variovorax sp. PAMC 28711]|uniref:hypothetical protein n=1 Tax=Variovorax sp. PAMC 28711 TaxID=1795631 RepID=UPI000AFD1164|nr:hypothetical protein [Variovorax sp. PAMC 28711]
MKKALRICLLASSLVVLAGCAPQTLQSTPTQSYRVGQRINATPGGVILSSQTGTIRTVRRWVGILNSPDGWETTTGNDSSFLRKELLYSGISGSTIEIGYREFRGGMAAPAFYQSAKYDLSASKAISFQNFRFEVDSADNNGMTGTLISDGTTTASATATSSPAVPQGKDTLMAERLAKERSCSPQPKAILSGKGAGFEAYMVSCTNGDALSIRCEFGNCRVLQ